MPKKAPMSELDDVANEVFAAAEDDTSVQLSLLCKIAFQSIRVRTSCFNPRRSRRRSCFVGEFEKKLCK